MLMILILLSVEHLGLLQPESGKAIANGVRRHVCSAGFPRHPEHASLRPAVDVPVRATWRSVRRSTASGSQVGWADSVLDDFRPRKSAESAHLAGGPLAGAVPTAGQGPGPVQLCQQREGRHQRKHSDPPFAEHGPEAVGRDAGPDAVRSFEGKLMSVRLLAVQ